MERAYDLKDLANKMKNRGLNVAEEGAAQAYEALKEWFVESAELSATPFDNMVVPFLAQIDTIVKPAIDKIDGQVG